MSQTTITVYVGDASPTTIIVRSLPQAPAAPITTIYVRAGEASPTNIIVRDPTVAPPPVSGATITVNSAAITLTGSSVNVRVSRRIAVNTVAATLAGSSVNVRAGRRISVNTTAVALAGGTVNLTATQTQAPVTPTPPALGGGGAPIWSEVSWFKKKKKPKKEELVEEVAEVVEQAIPAITQSDSRVVAQRIVSQISYAQLRKIESLEAFIARVESELAEMDDEEVLLLAA